MKKEIVTIWLETGKINFALRKKSGENLLELARKNSLEKFITPLLLRED